MTYTVSYLIDDGSDYVHFFNVPKEDVGSVVTTLVRERRATICVTASNDPEPGRASKGLFVRKRFPRTAGIRGIDPLPGDPDEAY